MARPDLRLCRRPKTQRTRPAICPSRESCGAARRLAASVIAPRHAAVSLRGAADRRRQQHPTFRKSDSAIELDKVIAILPFEIAGGAHDQYRPTFSRIKIRRSGEHGHCIRRHSVSALAGQRLFLRAQRDISFDR